MGHIGHTGPYGATGSMGLPVGIPNTHSRNAWLLSCSDIGIMSELPVRTATVNYFLIKTNGWEVGMT